jgi:hypothetical protein
LLEAAAAAAGGDDGWLGLVMQVLDRGNPSGPPPNGNPGGRQGPRRP